MRKLINKIKLFFIGLFFGLKSADLTLLHQKDNNGEDNDIDQQMKVDNVMSDFLQEQETQKVIETRDAYYRLLFEADNYTVKIKYDENGDVVGYESYRNNGKWIKVPDIIDTNDGLKVKVIQDNEIIQKESSLIVSPNSVTTPLLDAIYKDLLSKNLNDYLMLLELDYGDETPKYRLDKYTKKIVVKGEPDNCVVELYVGKYQEQFNKVHALFLSEIDRMKNVEGYRSDICYINRIGFITNGRAWGASPAAVFSFKDIKYDGIREYDGNYILSFKCTAIKFGENVGEKYRTKELDEKYKNKAQKNDVISMDAAAYGLEKTRLTIDNDTKIQ